MKMVFNQISEEQSTSNDQPEYSIKKKIFTCEELEGRKMKLSKSNNLKKITKTKALLALKSG